MSATIPLRDPALARELADLAARLTAHYTAEAADGLQGARAGARMWADIAAGLADYLRPIHPDTQAFMDEHAPLIDAIRRGWLQRVPRDWT